MNGGPNWLGPTCTMLPAVASRVRCFYDNYNVYLYGQPGRKFSGDRALPMRA